jgi:hypothetical protein
MTSVSSAFVHFPYEHDPFTVQRRNFYAGNVEVQITDVQRSNIEQWSIYIDQIDNIFRKTFVFL